MGVALSDPHELRAGSPGLSHVHMDLRDHFPLEVRTSRLQRARAQATTCTTPFSYSMGMGPPQLHGQYKSTHTDSSIVFYVENYP